MDKLQRHHWDFLYSQVSLNHSIAGASSTSHPRRMKLIQQVRTALCDEVSVSEEFVSPGALSEFYSRHEKHARLCLQYPTATVHKDSCPWAAVSLYQQSFRDQVLAESAPACLRGEVGEASYARTLRVARDHACIVLPLASADACITVAFSMLKCAEVFKDQCWYALDHMYGSFF